jgi:hypothetical protein
VLKCLIQIVAQVVHRLDPHRQPDEAFGDAHLCAPLRADDPAPATGVVPRIEVAYIDGPMRHMSNKWVFNAQDRGTLIDFHVEFEFRSKILETLIGALFHEAVRRMVNAFETRAAKLYGSQPITPV